MTQPRAAIGIDIGGTKILGTIVDTAGAVRESQQVPTPAGGAGRIIDATRSLVQSLRASSTGELITACGVGTAGVVVGNQVVSANALIPDWAGAPLAPMLADELGCPVSLLNDVHAAAVGELRVGALRDSSQALVVAVGTGVGGALVMKGRVAEGARGIAGSIGHIPAPHGGMRTCPCGARGHLEAYAGGRGMEQSYREQGGDVGSLRDIAARARDGEALARQVIAGAAALLGRALGGLANTLDLDTVLLAGGVPDIGGLYWDALLESLRTEGMRSAAVRVVPAQLGGYATAVGAALHSLALTRAKRADE